MSDTPGSGPFPGMSFPPPPPPPGGGSLRTGPAWEGDGAPVEKFIATARALVTDPNGFFPRLRLSGGLQNPIIYLAIGLAIAGLASAVYSFVTPSSFMGNFGAMSSGGVMMVVMYPVMGIVGSFIGAGLFHLVLSLLGGVKQPFEATYRVVAYVMGTTSLFSLVPICGGFIGGIYAIYLYIVGLANAHECDTTKAAIAVLAPVAICCALWALAALVFGVALAGLFGAAASMQ
ncbi:MAG: YIP1 family protein [Acidobacteria bacterium]|nr:YIP1 family protein [Acidobacteriota bacterium]